MKSVPKLYDIWHNGIQDLLDRFSQSFHQMIAFWLQLIDRDLFFDISRDVPVATNLGYNLRNALHSATFHFKTG